MTMLKPRLSGDAATVDLTLEGRFTGPELEGLIADLAVLRNQMSPEVPRECPTRETVGDQNVSVQDDPDFQLRLLRDGSIRLWIRSRGLGWLVFNIPVSNACAMRDYLVANTPKDGATGDFFTDDVSDPATSH